MSRPIVTAVAQAFKGTFPVADVEHAFARAIERAGGSPRVIRGSDGGDGLLDALQSSIVRRTEHRTEDPLRRPITAPVAWLDDGTAVVESRLACGLSLLSPDERNPLRTSTRGVGLLVAQAVAAGARTVYLGLGGSATMDGGLGMARAWGWVPRNSSGRELPEGGGALVELDRLAPGALPSVGLVGLCDVANPLLGPRGARVYARQKGASGEDEQRLAHGLARLAGVTGQEGPGGFTERPGAGAAGGLGFGLLAFGQGRLEPGAAWVLDRAGFDAALGQAAFLLVGEGAFDRTSLEGKLSGVAISRARARGMPVGLVSPRASDVPADVLCETGGGSWDLAELERRATEVVRRARRLLGA